MSTEAARLLLLSELRELYDLESQMTRALPRMAELSTLPRLKAMFAHQLEQTRQLAERLAGVLAGLGENVRRRTRRSLSRLIAEGTRVIFTADGSESINRELVNLVRRVERYELTACGCALTYAELLGYVDVARLLRAALQEKEAVALEFERVERRDAGAYLRPPLGG